ncbi:MAG: peptidoglycan DD-metalloendopeptidase family protein [Candidatus Heimdallarchaeota archaeon]|nr:peptidoglycan DD-metalloendopeptidase family protein [Candidatus Heimdallarchaeota archaeon]
MEITFLPSDYLITVCRKIEDENFIESDFLLRAVRIRNTTEKSVKLIKYRFQLLSNGNLRKTISYTEEKVKEKAQELQLVVDQLLTNKQDKVQEIARKGNLQLFLGQEDFWSKDHFSNNELTPNQETGFRLEHFRICDENPIDEIFFTVIYQQENEEKSTSIKIPLKGYETKNDYIFPLKGSWVIFGNWDDPHNHRTMNSQEFAMDLIQLDNELMFDQIIEKPNEAFPFYGEDLLAIADGEVIDCVNTVPENPGSLRMIPNEERRKIIEELGFVPLASGNYIVLKHGQEEYSFYAHVQEGSLKVKKGDQVKQGQIIGKLGNSGNSTGPHLHFQLMDKPSILTGRGLPCRFTNLKNMVGEPMDFIENNYQVVHSIKD